MSQDPFQRFRSPRTTGDATHEAAPGGANAEPAPTPPAPSPQRATARERGH